MDSIETAKIAATVRCIMEQMNLSKPDKDPEAFIKNIGEFRYEPSVGEIFTTWHGSMIYDVEVGKDTWVRHHNQLRRRLAEPTSDKRYLSLHSLLDTFNLTHVIPPRSQSIDQVTVPSRTARTRWKPSRLQIDLSSKTYG
ncbi:unnamed protein product [Hymenolepis diminuta]|uniref:Reverse transcriptase domain-containing protein n=1 Tax=Hymenolepis diminuta TaxID=6216 RepID=A0A0R3SZC9_HYMDI|nr:unnamed protein product [Hymenolepis diminuta]